ncbi:hypothetical protein GCM10009864_52930 [Streptomyces lunalinharesii]|uniref:Transposase n=1 Tax=Streptomyces lunalinharesii TaxID=333384 RepID=A0ABP6ET37_9ACTN
MVLAGVLDDLVVEGLGEGQHAAKNKEVRAKHSGKGGGGRRAGGPARTEGWYARARMLDCRWDSGRFSAVRQLFSAAFAGPWDSWAASRRLMAR